MTDCARPGRFLECKTLIWITFTVSLTVSHHVDASRVALGAHRSDIGHSRRAPEALLPTAGRQGQCDHHNGTSTASGTACAAAPSASLCPRGTQYGLPSSPAPARERCSRRRPPLPAGTRVLEGQTRQRRALPACLRQEGWTERRHVSKHTPCVTHCRNNFSIKTQGRKIQGPLKPSLKSLS